jgi:ATP diphosphatase
LTLALPAPSNSGMTNPELKPGRDIAVLIEIMRRLRAPGGCPWDRAQTFQTVAPYTIEEAYEVATVIEDGDFKALPGELGDLLFQVVFHAHMAEEAGLFDFGDVVQAVTDKMIRRHPHVFGREEAMPDPAAQKTFWEKLKETERSAKGHTSVLDDVATALPALMRAEKLQRRLSSVGFDWNSAEKVLDKIVEEAHEIVEARASGASPAEIAGEVGDLLFAVANLARHLKIDPEAALRTTNAKVTRRFKYVETALAVRGENPGETSLEEMEALWQEAKSAEAHP